MTVMAGSRRLMVYLAAVVATQVSCTAAPPETGKEDDDAANDYFPLVDGARWEYAHSDWTERVEAHRLPGSANGPQTFLVSDTPNPDDELRSESVFIRTAEGRVLRVDKTLIFSPADGDEEALSYTTYSPGFTRFAASWVTQRAGFEEEPSYTRQELDLLSMQLAEPEERRHIFRVIERDVTVKTAAGSFGHCIRVLRTKAWQAADDDADAQEKNFWFCEGVGKVREENLNTGSVEELIDYSIPTAD